MGKSGDRQTLEIGKTLKTSKNNQEVFGMGFKDFIKNVFRIKTSEEEDTTVDLKHANLESTEGSHVDVDGDYLAGDDNEEASRIEKAGSFQKAGEKPAANASAQFPAVKKVSLVCGSCNYKFSRADDNVPKMCPYCGKDL